MPARVEVRVFVDPVQDVLHELAQVQPRRDADLAAELPGQRAGEVVEVGVVGDRPDTVRVARRSRVEIADGSTE